MVAVAWAALASPAAGWPARLPQDLVLRIAMLGAVVLAALIALVMLQVLLLATWAGYERRRRAGFEATWRSALAIASIDPDAAPPPDAPTGRARLWWLILWNRMQRRLRGNAHDRLNRLLRDIGLEHDVLDHIRRGGVRRRLIGLETLRHLGDPRHWSAALSLLRSTNPFVSLAAAHALVAMDAPRAVALLLPVAVARRDWSVPRLRALCQQAGRPAVTAPLLHALDEGEPRTLDRLVPLLGFADPALAAPWARGCLAHDPDAQHRLVAVRVLGELRDPRDHAALVRTLRDEDAGVRLAAVEALRAQAGADDLDVLLPLLADRSWWVRQATADALAELPGMATTRLHALLPALDDPYARQALERALAVRAAAVP